MRYYPALLDLKDKQCCVIGGGCVAVRTARSLRAAGAAVTVIAPRLSKVMARLVQKGSVARIPGVYQKKYLTGAFLVIGATADPRVNSRVSSDAARMGILANIVDRPAESNFIVPAVLHKGGLIIAVSTSGRAPALSRRIKLDLRARLLGKYTRALCALAKERRRLRRTAAGFAQRKRVLTRMAKRALRLRRI